MGLPRNDVQLRTVMADDVERGLNYALKDFVNNLEQSFVDEQIPVQTGGLGDVSGVWGPKVEGGSTPELSLEYDQSKLIIDPMTYRHSSPLGTPFDNFATLIEEGRGGILNMFGGENNPTTQPRPFWENYSNRVSSQWESWISSGFRRAGIKRR